MRTTLSKRQRAFRLCALFYTGLLLYLGLTPFVFLPDNGVHWNRLKAALEFDGQGIAYSQGWVELGPATGNRLGIHLIAESKMIPTTGLGTLLSLDDGQELPLVLIAQWSDWVIVRIRSDRTGLERGYWEIGELGTLTPGAAHLISLISSEDTGTDLYVDGQLVKHAARPILESRVDRPFRLVLGSSPLGRAGWNGFLHGLRLQTTTTKPTDFAGFMQSDSKPFDVEALLRQTDAIGAYALDTQPQMDSGAGLTVPNQLASAPPGGLLIPNFFAPLTRSILSMPKRDFSNKSWFIKDIAQNFLGFIPLGVLLMLAWRPSARETRGPNILVVTILCGAFLSLTIELIQVYQPVRVSSLLDLTLNTAGCAVGATCAAGIRRVLQARSR